MKLECCVRELPMPRSFRIARSCYSSHRSILVRVSDGVHQGFGEASPNPYYGSTLYGMLQSLQRCHAELQRLVPTKLRCAVTIAEQQCADDMFTLSAVEMAICDLFSRKNGVSLSGMLGVNGSGPIRSAITIGLMSRPQLQQRIAAVSHYPILKIKVGDESDLENVRFIRQHSDAAIWVDANEGWSVEQAIGLSHHLADLGCELIEQPITSTDIDGQRRVHEQSALPIFADESCVTEEDVIPCADRFDGINIKLSKCGGLHAAMRMIGYARSTELKVMLGCFTESSVAIAAAAAIAPLADYVDLDGMTHVRETTPTGLELNQGYLTLPHQLGSGINCQGLEGFRTPMQLSSSAMSLGSIGTAG